MESKLSLLAERKRVEWLAGTLDHASNISLDNPGCTCAFQDTVLISFGTR